MERLNSFMTIERVKDTYYNNNSIKPTNSDKSSSATKSFEASENNDFKHILEQAKDNDNKVTFSKHANERLESRNINLSDEQMIRLNRGIMQAKEKSIKESLVMMDDIAFIVNIKSNTVITAVDKEKMDNNVFTNIDGAVIV